MTVRVPYNLGYYEEQNANIHHQLCKVASFILKNLPRFLSEHNHDREYLQLFKAFLFTFLMAVIK